MSENLVKIKNVKSTEYTVYYPLPNGSFTPYIWKGIQGSRVDELDVPQEVYKYIMYQTGTFQNGFLVLSDEEDDDLVIEEVEEATKDLTVYSLDQIKELLSKNANEFKKVVTADLPTDVIKEIVRVANEMKIDSSAIKKHLAKLLGYENDVEALFNDNDGE